MEAVKRFRLLALMFGIAVMFCFAQTVSAQDIYIITGSGSLFTATKGDIVVGFADQPIQFVIDEVKADAAGGNCTVQFGDGTTALNIGAVGIGFDGGENGTDWGLITLTGRITTSLNSSTSAAVVLSNGVSINSMAIIVNTATANGHGIRHNSTETLTISGGTVSATSGRAVHNNSTGAVTISGGTVSATTGYAVYNASTGIITVSGEALVTSTNMTAEQGTIFLGNSGTETTARLIIEGGRVENTRTGSDNAITVYNGSVGLVTISGGTVHSAGGGTGGGRAVSNNAAGSVIISGGTVSSTSGIAVTNSPNGSIMINGGTVTGSIAVRNSSRGEMIISGSALITSANARATEGTILLNGNITIEGGTVENRASGYAIYNACNCSVNISGGTVRANTGRAVHNADEGTIRVSGSALVTSANTSITTDGTIVLASAGTRTVERLIVEGGRVENRAGGNTIWNSSSGAVRISGGTVSAITGRAVYNNTNGRIIVSGEALVTSASIDQSTIVISGGSATNERLLMDGGRVENTASGNAINNLTEGSITISGGTVSANTGRAIITWASRLAARVTISGSALITSASTVAEQSTITLFEDDAGTTERLIISGGRVENRSTGNTVLNRSTGLVSISGGTVSASAGIAVLSSSTGRITISGNALVTSSNTSVATGTIHLANVGTATTERLAVEGGGTVENEASGNAIYNTSTHAVNIRGGRVLAKDGYAIYRNSTGVTTLSGGLSFAYGTSVGNVIYGTFNTLNNDVVAIMAWNIAAGNIKYAPATNTDIFVWPATATAIWDNQDGIPGIAYANSANTGFIALDVTVGSDAVIFPTTTPITYDPTKPLSQVAFVGGSGDGTFQWKDGTIIPTVNNSGYDVVFTPTGGDNSQSITKTVALTVAKANPPHTAPTGLTAKVGETLANVVLPEDWAWVDSSALVGALGDQKHEAVFTPVDRDNFNTVTVEITVKVDNTTSVLSPDRLIPSPNSPPLEGCPKGGVVSPLSGKFTAGPNPAALSAGIVNFFWQGKLIQNGRLTVFDASGNVVDRVAVSDRVDHPGAARHPSGGGELGRRIVGSWDLTDRKGRVVSEGTYLVKGVITVDGKKERISAIIGVR